jgi:hypothetical protein
MRDFAFFLPVLMSWHISREGMNFLWSQRCLAVSRAFLHGAISQKDVIFTPATIRPEISQIIFSLWEQWAL